jgi:hypothetical protein
MITNPGAQINAEGATIAVTIASTDPDGDALIYTADGLPTGLTINPTTGLISGTIPFTAANDYMVSVNASDGTVTTSTSFDWIVTNTNRAPVAANRSVAGNQNSAIAVMLSATDADGDTVTYAIATPPAHGTLNGVAPSLTYTPVGDYHGADSFTYTASDGAATSNLATVSITVHEVASEPPPPPPAHPSYVPLTPGRVLESRVGEASTIDGLYWQIGQLHGGTVTEMTVTGRHGIPADATAVVLNVTVTEPTGAGYVTVYPCGTDTPGTSNLNYTPGQTIANTVIAKIGTDGKICIYTSTTTHLVIDLNGYYTGTV